MFPEAGGSSSFARHAFNELVSFFAGWALSLDYILTIAISAFFVPHYLSAFPGLGGLDHNPGDIFGGLIVVVAARRPEHPRPGGVGQAQLHPGDRGSLDAGSACCGRGGASARPVAADPPGSSRHGANLARTDLRAVARDARLYRHRDGLQHGRGGHRPWPAGSQGREPRGARGARRVSGDLDDRALGAASVHHGVVQPRSRTKLQAPGYATEALAGISRTTRCWGSSRGLGLHGTVLTVAQYYVGLLAATILFIATNAGMIGISRLSWSLAEHRQLPGIFSQLHARYRTPWFTILFFSGLAGIAGAVWQHQRAGQSVLVRRAALVHGRPHLGDRPARQGARPRASLPDAMERAHPRSLDTADGGHRRHRHSHRMGGGRDHPPRGAFRRHPMDGPRDGGYVLYRRRQGLDLRETCRIERAERPADFEALGYRTALVPIFGGDVSASALSSAAKLIGEDGVVYAVFVLPVPSQLSLEAGLEAEEAEGRSALESARIKARRSNIKIRTGLIRTRNPGAALVDEAKRVGRGRDLLVDDPRTRGRAADRADRHLPAEQAPVPGDHRDGEPARTTDRSARAGATQWRARLSDRSPSFHTQEVHRLKSVSPSGESKHGPEVLRAALACGPGGQRAERLEVGHEVRYSGALGQARSLRGSRAVSGIRRSSSVRCRRRAPSWRWSRRERWRACWMG